MSLKGGNSGFTSIDYNRPVLKTKNAAKVTEETYDDLPVWQFYIGYIFVPLFVLSFYLGNFWLISWFAFSVIPILDIVFPVDLKNPTHKQMEEVDKKLKYRIPLYLFVVVETIIVFYSCYAVATMPFTIGQFVGLVISVGITTGGLGLTISHELFHKLDKTERFLGLLLLAYVNYMHFFIEHQSGHHKNVATEEDPASAEAGLSVYRFVPRSLIGGYRSAWNIESERLAKRKTSMWSMQNQMIWYAIVPTAIAATLGVLLGQTAVVFFYAQAAVAILLLEVVNYVEHYGLRRAKIPIDGTDKYTYEDVNITHSWNAPHKITNYFTFKLQRHSDHHAHALRNYHVLRCFHESPQMPTGYAGMVLLSIVPPMWIPIMSKLTADYYAAADKKCDPAKLRNTTVEAYVVGCAALVSFLTFAPIL